MPLSRLRADDNGRWSIAKGRADTPEPDRGRILHPYAEAGEVRLRQSSSAAGSMRHSARTLLEVGQEFGIVTEIALPALDLPNVKLLESEALLRYADAYSIWRKALPSPKTPTCILERKTGSPS
jgi:hypothetical protein